MNKYMMTEFELLLMRTNDPEERERMLRGRVLRLTTHALNQAAELRRLNMAVQRKTHLIRLLKPTRAKMRELYFQAMRPGEARIVGGGEEDGVVGRRVSEEGAKKLKFKDWGSQAIQPFPDSAAKAPDGHL